MPLRGIRHPAREMALPDRKVLWHDVPSWVDPDASDYFITICCKQRGANQLCTPGVGPALLEAATFYRNQRKWCPTAFLLMPDHVHMITSFGREYRIEEVVSAWKRYAANKYKIVWQQGFFEHRLRHNESAEEKTQYILQNPVRAGLVGKPEEWPFLLLMND